MAEAKKDEAKKKPVAKTTSAKVSKAKAVSKKIEVPKDKKLDTPQDKKPTAAQLEARARQDKLVDAVKKDLLPAGTSEAQLDSYLDEEVSNTSTAADRRKIVSAKKGVKEGDNSGPTQLPVSNANPKPGKATSGEPYVPVEGPHGQFK